MIFIKTDNICIFKPKVEEQKRGARVTSWLRQDSDKQAGMVDYIWRFLYGKKPKFLEHLWHKNLAYIPCIFLRTRLYWRSLAGNSVSCIHF